MNTGLLVVGVLVGMVRMIRSWEYYGPILVLGLISRSGLMMEEAGKMVIVVGDRLSLLGGVDPFVRWLDGPLSGNGLRKINELVSSCC